MQEIQAKGLTFASVLGALDDLRGPAFRQRVLDALPEESGSALKLGSVIASGWYPIRWYRELFKAALSESGDLDFAREIGRASVRREIKGVHRLLFKVISVDTLQQHGARFFKAYFHPTTVTTERVGPGVGRTRYSKCVGFDKNLWHEQLGCIEELLVQSGVKLPRIRIVAGGGEDDGFAEFETRWR
jgi:hypothetical protein